MSQSMMIAALLALVILCCCAGSTPVREPHQESEDLEKRGRHYIGKRGRMYIGKKSLMAPRTDAQGVDAEEWNERYADEATSLNKRGRLYIGKRDIPEWFEVPESEKVKNEITSKNRPKWNGFFYDDKPSKRSVDLDSIYDLADSVVGEGSRGKRARHYIG